MQYLSSGQNDIDRANPSAHIASISIMKESAKWPGLLVTYYREAGFLGDTFVKHFMATETPGVFEEAPDSDLNGLRLRGNT